MTEHAKALYLFPTKALAQDQVAELLELNQAGALGVKAFTFDGDTPGDARQAIRLHGDVVVSNPDMLHQAILAHPDADLLDPSLGPTEERPTRRTVQ